MRDPACVRTVDSVNTILCRILTFVQRLKTQVKFNITVERTHSESTNLRQASIVNFPRKLNAERLCLWVGSVV